MESTCAHLRRYTVIVEATYAETADRGNSFNVPWLVLKSMVALRLPEAPRGSLRRPEAPRGLSSSQRRPGLPGHSQKLPEAPKHSQRLQEAPRGSRTLPEAPRGPQRLPEAPRGSHTPPALPGGSQRPSVHRHMTVSEAKKLFQFHRDHLVDFLLTPDSVRILGSANHWSLNERISDAMPVGVGRSRCRRQFHYVHVAYRTPDPT